MNNKTDNPLAGLTTEELMKGLMEDNPVGFPSRMAEIRRRLEQGERMRKALDEAEAALATVVCRGHYDTCPRALDSGDSCSCPWDVAREAMQIINRIRDFLSSPTGGRPRHLPQ